MRLIFGESERNNSLTEISSLLDAYPHFIPYIELVGTAVAAWILFYVCRSVLRRIVGVAAKKSDKLWVQVLFDRSFLFQASWILPVILIHLGVNANAGLREGLKLVLLRMTLSVLVLIGLRALTLLLGNINKVYSNLEVARNRPIKGIIQVLVILLYLAALILIISILVGRSPWVFLSGLGAMTAILLLIFRDTLLSLVAGFQLTTNDFIRVGDWVEIPQFGADGDVIDIALHAVRVQNWDRTITVIPTHKFLEHAFKNWRGMQESGGRRIKRSIFVDMGTARFLTKEEIEKYKHFVLLKDYIAAKCQELEESNRQFANDPSMVVNSRRLTNIGTFRAYLVQYLKQHSRIHQGMTQLVRQLQPGPNGLPIEIYVFTNTTAWGEYESIQADIFDHIIAIAPEFGLKLYQYPSGGDLRAGLKLS